MTKTVSAIASLASAFIGRSVLVTDKAGTEARYTITQLSDKLGSLKDGSKGEYVILTKDGETGVVMNLHPQSAKSLFAKGEADRLKLVEETAKPAKTKKVKAAKVPKEAAVPVEKAASKKSLTLALFKELTAEGKARKDIIVRMKADLGLSAAGANTYYQNCKSGFWA